MSSEPTGWDGDLGNEKTLRKNQPRSKPTGWDGDTSKTLYSILSLTSRSKPTAWDGD